ncbi:hypothetical protein [Emergencia timonensis]|uniref:hypothetical protein n=1 Tax=Emergencia timonensis TaxID=1776384 RepID=UPI003993F2BD
MRCSSSIGSRGLCIIIKLELAKGEGKMIIMICLDDRGGMLFNKRRQSQDVLLRQQILTETAGQRLWMNSYSAKQFAEESAANIVVDETFMDKARPGDFCFIENVAPSAYEDKIEKIILYRWNRTYPGDLYFDIPLEEHGWKLIETDDFAGHSHEKITKEVYER